MEKEKVLVTIPAYNEERAIGRLVREIKDCYPQFHIAVINDGSPDNTAQEAESAGGSVFSLPFNLGIGGAVQTGYQIALEGGYDCMVQIDGDYQHDPKYIMAIIAPILSGELDLCIGSRFLSPDARFYRSTFLRRVGIRFFAILLGWLTGIHITDPTSGFRATGPKLIRRFAAYYPMDFPEPEAIQIAKRYGAKIGEAPVQMRKRLGGRSSIRYLITLYYMIKVTFAILIDTLKRKE
ncbi:MAG TPA: glycosyltransferase family 2 protein [Candidatus Omnitrophota bacterium]|nr:glycosyltransferase family 2 protein [Candidatus Omnitrophota bacterium]